jgi:hypothetical protein
VEITGAEKFSGIDIRFGPFPRITRNPGNLSVENSDNCSWVWMRDLKSDTKSVTLNLPL